MIIVTGGAGFIGSNLVKGLNQKGIDNILVVDDLTEGKKFQNISDCNILDYLDKDDFIERIQNRQFNNQIDAIFHQGACSATTEWDGRYMMENNYEYSKKLLHVSINDKIPFMYASSAAVYGDLTTFKEERQYEKPLNVYAYSKFQFDQYVRRLTSQIESQVVGLRYFNVYGPREQHKGSMSSVAFHFNNQLNASGTVKLFEGCDGYGPGEQLRDFVFVQDAVDVNLWFLEHPEKSGIFNCGTGQAQSFNDVANSVIAWHGKGQVEYIPFPEHLKGCYQSFTQADLTNLRMAGYEAPFKTVEEGVKSYLDQMSS